jgi:hypothetical protein
MTDSEPILDLDLRHKTLVRGDITVIFTWLLSNQRPCMVLVPTKIMPTHERTMPCIVPLDIAFAWDEVTGDAAETAAMSFQFAAGLGMNPMEMRNVIKVTSVVRDCLGDLLRMPMFPADQREVVADVLITDTDTGKTTEAEAVDHV